MATFRPSARVRLHIRVEEFEDTADLTRRVQSSTPGIPATDVAAPVPAEAGSFTLTPGAASLDPLVELREVSLDLAFLIAQRETVPQDQFDRERAQLEQRRAVLQDQLERREAFDRAQERPQILSGAPPDNRVILGQILPESISIDRNGIRQADTCDITLNHADAPIDPRIVRACSIEVVLGTVLPSEFEAGMIGGEREDGVPSSIVGRDEGSGILNPSTRFTGWVDEWTVSVDGKSGDTIKLKCRDMTALLIDKELPRGVTINLDLPIRDGIQELLDTFAMTRGTRVFFGRPGETGEAGPIPSEALPQAQRGRRGRRASRARSGDQRMNLWDHITDTTVGLGLVPILFGYDLHLINPRTFYSGQDTARRMVYGENLLALKFARKLSGVKVPTIEVRCYDPQIGRTRWARHPVPDGEAASGIFGEADPPRPARAGDPGVTGEAPDDRIQTFTVSGINTPDGLATIARSIFQQIGRQEIEGSFETKEISSFESQAEGDLLDLNAGDAVELLVRSNPEQGNPDTGDSIEAEGASSFQQITAMARSRRSDYLVGIGWEREVADTLAALQDATGFQTTFRTQNVRIGFSAGDGISLKADYINFIVVREDELAAAAARGDEAERRASGRVRNRTRGNNSPEAEDLRRASRDRIELTRQREAGEIDDPAYQAQMEQAQELERERLERFDQVEEPGSRPTREAGEFL